VSVERKASRSRPVAELRAALAAVCFLTRLPLGRRVALDGEDLTRAGTAFPLVGAAIGAGVGALAVALNGPLSTLLAVTVAVSAGTLLTGALHLDALADTADALGAGSREQALAIMRDSTIGAFGATAIALDLLLKTAALAALVRDGRAVRYALVAGVLARVVAVLLAAALPYARAGAGAGVALTRDGGPRAAVAGGLAIAIAIAAAGAGGALLAGAAATLTLLFALAYRRWLAGVTGDALGAALELTETGLLLLAVGLAGGR
jgi:adenosylcobinamide-GDP ribazoletransferase